MEFPNLNVIETNRHGLNLRHNFYFIKAAKNDFYTDITVTSCLFIFVGSEGKCIVISLVF